MEETRKQRGQGHYKSQDPNKDPSSVGSASCDSAHPRLVAGTLAKTLTGLATSIAAKVAAYTYGCYINRMFGCPHGRIRDLWA